jgi:hypothetical protein
VPLAGTLPGTDSVAGDPISSQVNSVTRSCFRWQVITGMMSRVTVTGGTPVLLESRRPESSFKFQSWHRASRDSSNNSNSSHGDRDCQLGFIERHSTLPVLRFEAQSRRSWPGSRRPAGRRPQCRPTAGQPLQSLGGLLAS